MLNKCVVYLHFQDFIAIAYCLFNSIVNNPHHWLAPLISAFEIIFIQFWVSVRTPHNLQLPHHTTACLIKIPWTAWWWRWRMVPGALSMNLRNSQSEDILKEDAPYVVEMPGSLQTGYHSPHQTDWTSFVNPSQIAAVDHFRYAHQISEWNDPSSTTQISERNIYGCVLQWSQIIGSSFWGIQSIQSKAWSHISCRLCDVRGTAMIKDDNEVGGVWWNQWKKA